MKKSTLFLAAAAVIAIAISGCSTDPTYKAPGNYKKSETSVDKYGTKTTTTKNTTVYRDADGNKRAIEQTETSKDPQGLFNKSTTSTTKTYN